MNKKWLTFGALLAAIVLFFAVNILAGASLRSARLDLTQGKLYTLSEGSKNIARSVGEPITLTLYYSEKPASNRPGMSAYAARVREVLSEFARVSGGRIVFTQVNPEPFSEAEDAAAQAGLMGYPTGQGQERFFFGLVGKNSVDREETIPLFDASKEEFLEYDLARMIHLLKDEPRKPIGFMSWLNMEGAPGNPMMQQRGTPAWQIHTQLNELFLVKPVATNVSEIPADIKVLVAVHPKSISDETQYAIDQFVLRGGRLVLFVDPLCELDQPPGVNPMQAMGLPKASDAPKLLAAWGLELMPGKFAADKERALRVAVGSQNRPEQVDYLAWLQLVKDNLNSTDPTTGQLNNILVATSGILTRKDAPGLEITPLLHTGTDSAPLDTSGVQFMPDPKKLLAEFTPGGKELILAARVTGKARTAFPEGAPKPVTANEGEPPAAPPAAQLMESAESINVVVVADCDILADRFWVQRDQIAGIDLGLRKFSDNGDLLVGFLDNYTGSSDLMSLRARGRFARPFDRVNQIRKNAEQQYAAKEQELQSKLRETEKKINEVQRQKPDGTSMSILTPEQSAEIEKFRVQMADTRKELREVQHQLNKDIEGLGTRIKLINMGLMPAAVGVGALALAGYRASRRRTDRQSAGAKG